MMKARHFVYAITVGIGIYGVLFLSRNLGIFGDDTGNGWVYISGTLFMLLMEAIVFKSKDWMLAGASESVTQNQKTERITRIILALLVGGVLVGCFFATADGGMAIITAFPIAVLAVLLWPVLDKVIKRFFKNKRELLKPEATQRS